MPLSSCSNSRIRRPTHGAGSVRRWRARCTCSGAPCWISRGLLDKVRLPANYGAKKQHVAIARAFAAPRVLVICDEITASLDVSVKAAVVDAVHGTAYQS